jgi:hypothetical protein
MERNMLDTNAKPKWVHRFKGTQTDGTEREQAYIRDTFGSVDELEALGHEVLHVVAEWRQEIAERVLTPPTYKVFAFNRGGDEKIATCLQCPWTLVRVGKGTSVAFRVKEQTTRGSYQAWIVAAEKNVDGTLRWKRRFETPAIVNQRDLLHVFQCTLTYSPSLGDLVLARAKTRVEVS